VLIPKTRTYEFIGWM